MSYYVAPDSHYWTSLDMMESFFRTSPDLNREYILTGLRNMKVLGYAVINRRQYEKERKSKAVLQRKAKKGAAVKKKSRG